MFHIGKVGHHRYYRRADLSTINQARAFEVLSDVSIRVILRIKPPVSQVCGPLSTGGLGSFDKNLNLFGVAVRRLESQGRRVFDQTPFEDAMQRIKESAYHQGGTHLLEVFYRPIFEAHLVHLLHFLPGWEASTGASWEHDLAKRLGIQIAYLDEKFLRAAVRK